MKTINLTNLERSDIKYKVSKFPDGQQQIVIDSKWDLVKFGENNFVYRKCEPKFYAIAVQIKSRLNNFKDLELIICTTKSLRNLGVKEIHLYTPYFLGSRSDRQFEEGSNNYLKDVICPIINNLNFESVTVLDPHSDVLEACLNNFKKVSNLELVNWVIFSEQYRGEKNMDKPNFILVSPDAGASKKIYKIAEQIGYKGDIITCSKDRDVNGKLTRTVVPHAIIVDNPDKDLIIIDDICDGGATFINIAKFIKENYGSVFNSKIYFIVTHGVFSKGFEELSKYFDGIYCTNSYSSIGDYAGNDMEKTFVKQLNVF